MTRRRPSRLSRAPAAGAVIGAAALGLAACSDSLTGPSPVGLPAGTAERDALAALYNTAGGPNWTRSTNWLGSESLDTWYGVETENDRVTGLDLGGPDGNNLRGTIAPEIGALTNATDLRLSNNFLAGGIPATLGQMRSLEILRLSNNALSGEVPVQLVNLANLVELRLHRNRLTGELPRGLMDLSDLRRLRIEDNAGLCAPSDADFRAWLATLDEFVSDCDASAPAASGAQAVSRRVECRSVACRVVPAG